MHESLGRCNLVPEYIIKFEMEFLFEKRKCVKKFQHTVF